MNPGAFRTFRIGLAAGLAAACLGACQRRLPADRFVVEYEKAALATAKAGPVVFSGLLESPDYLRAKAALHGTAAGSYGGNGLEGVYVRVSMRPAGPGKGETAGNGIIPEGEVLRTLQNGLAPYIRLVDGKGHSVAPLAYHFERGYPPSPIHAFQFAFPRRDKGRDLDLASAEIVLSEFGLYLGEVRLPCKSPAQLHLKDTP